MKPHHIFFVLMATSSAVTLGKSAVLAGILSADDFALYSAAFSIVGFVASALSFGLTDGMVKTFTRLVAYGRPEELRQTLGRDTRTIVLRHALALPVAIVAAVSIYGTTMIGPAIAVVLLALATNGFGVAASLFRAYDRLIGLGMVSCARAGLAMTAAAGGGILAGWQAGLTAEAIASVLVAAVALLYLRRLIRTNAEGSAVRTRRPDAYISSRSDGLWLFGAVWAALIPSSFDKLWVVHFANAGDAATYAFCAIWILAAFTVTSIYIQKLGPELIRLKAANKPILALSMVKAVQLSCLLVAGGALGFALLYALPQLGLWEKYDLTIVAAAATLVACFVQVSPVFDWCLIAMDAEKSAFASAMAFAGSFLLLFSLAATLGAGVIGYMAALAAARLIQLVLSASMIVWLERRPVR